MDAGGRFFALVAVVVSLLSQNVGAALAKGLFVELGARGTVALRVGLAAGVVNAAVRPWRAWPALEPAARRDLVRYGLTLGLMNLLIYQAFARIPIGVALAIEIVGPLGVAVASSRRPLDGLWIGLAAAGLSLLLPWRGLQAGLDPLGVGFAVWAAVCWAGYIVLGKRVAGRVPASVAVAVGLGLAAAVVVPFGVWQSGSLLWQPRALGWGLAIALLSSVLPYSLEMLALRRLPRGVFGMLVSSAPAVTTLAGWWVLGEQLSLAQAVAVGCVVVAAGCASLAW